jgi:lysine 2,3-aminomutase
MPEPTEALHAVAGRYAVAITPAMSALIDPLSPDDPIARQFIPDVRELQTTPEERPDPIGDRTHEKVPGLVHRYPDRVLLKVTHTCPVYCRFCFRREVVGPTGEPAMTTADLSRALAYVAAHPSIFEVILTGGDPLVLSPRRISALTAALAEIPHVAVLRWHSRVPVVDPGRLTPEAIAALISARQAVYLAIHANHPRELTPAARTVIAALRRAGIILLSQTVLLKGINDDAPTLAELFRAFVALGIKPYYLHHPDLAPGTSHFRLSIEDGQRLMAELRGRITGLAMPTYVLDIPGGHGKMALTPSAWDRNAGTVTDPWGNVHPYPPRDDA